MNVRGSKRLRVEGWVRGSFKFWSYHLDLALKIRKLVYYPVFVRPRSQLYP